MQCNNLELMSKALEEPKGPVVGFTLRKVAYINDMAGKIDMFEQGKVEGRGKSWRRRM